MQVTLEKMIHLLYYLYRNSHLMGYRLGYEKERNLNFRLLD